MYHLALGDSRAETRKREATKLKQGRKPVSNVAKVNHLHSQGSFETSRYMELEFSVRRTEVTL